MSNIKEVHSKPACMCLSTYYLEYGSHLARLHRRRRRRRRVYAPTSNTASHDNHEKINSWVSFCFPLITLLIGSEHLSVSGRRWCIRESMVRLTLLAPAPPPLPSPSLLLWLTGFHQGAAWFSLSPIINLAGLGGPSWCVGWGHCALIYFENLSFSGYQWHSVSSTWGKFAEAACNRLVRLLEEITITLARKSG